MCQHVIIFIDLISQLSHIVVVAIVIDLMDDAVDKWRDTIDERYLGTLVQIAPLIIFESQTTHGQLVLSLFDDLI